MHTTNTNIQPKNAAINITTLTYTADVEENTAPKYNTIPPQQVKKNSVLLLNLSEYFYDKEDDKLTYTVSSDNEQVITALIRQEIVSIQPRRDFLGKAKLTFTASDSQLSTSTSTTVTIVETRLNKPPQLTKNIENKTTDQTINLNNYFSDPDNDTLQYEAIVTGKVTITITGSSATIIPNADFTGKAFAFITANDSQFTEVSNIFNITTEEIVSEKQEAAVQVLAQKDKPVKGIVRQDLATWNSNTIQLSNGKLQTDFRIKWVNYLDENNSWKSINPDFVKVGNEWIVKDAPFIAKAPLKSDGIATFISNNRWDIFDKKKITSPPLTQTIQALNVNSVEGVKEKGNLGFGNTTYIVYENAYPSLNADLIYWVHQGRGTRLDKLVRFNTAPSEDVRLEFEIKYLTNNNKKTTIKEIKKELNKGKINKSEKLWNKQAKLNLKL